MEIKDIINSIYRLPQASLDAFACSVVEVEYPKHFHLHRQGRQETKCYFIKQGIVRAYTLKEDKEVTFWFGKEGSIAFPLQTMLTGLKDYANVELLEDCTLYEICLQRLEELYLSDIHLATWGRKFAEDYCIRAEKLFITRQFKTSAERYQELTSEYPDLLQRVPLGIIASYLGITQVNLSRIRAKTK